MILSSVLDLISYSETLLLNRSVAISVRLIQMYVWLVETIRRAARIYLEDINYKWIHSNLNDEKESDIPERTFRRHRGTIENLFGIEILCDHSNGNIYYIGNEDILEIHMA